MWPTRTKSFPDMKLPAAMRQTTAAIGPHNCDVFHLLLPIVEQTLTNLKRY